MYRLFANLSLSVFLSATSLPVAADCVVLLHGLARTPASMDKLAEHLDLLGYTTINVGYPSREQPIEQLAPLAVGEGLSRCPSDKTVHFVTHSMGGILVRYYLADNEIPQLGRVVMLAPPNQGSQVVDALNNMPGYELLNGPAGQQLGTDPQSIPSQLGPVEFELGIIAGDRTINPILSQYLPNPDDGKVSVENTKVAGMHDFIQVPHSHALIMNSPEVFELISTFIETGAFMQFEP